MDNICKKYGAVLGDGVHICPICSQKAKQKILGRLTGLLGCTFAVYSLVGMLIHFRILEFADSRLSEQNSLLIPPVSQALPGASEEIQISTIATETDAYQRIAEHCIMLEMERGAAAVLQYLQTVEVDYENPQYQELLSDYQKIVDDEVLTVSDAYAADGDYLQAIRTIWNTEDYAESELLMTALIRYFRIPTVHRLAAGRRFTGLINSDRTVSLWGSSEKGWCDTSAWKNVESISLGDYFIVGLTYDGNVFAAGPKEYYSEVMEWTDISILTTGDGHTVGLKKDGTLLATGLNRHGQLNVENLYGDSPIVAIAAGYDHTVALRADGTVAAVGRNNLGQCDVSGWTNIVAIAAGSEHTVGLRADGTVVATGDDSVRQCSVGNWSHIISAGEYHTVGLCADGYLNAVGYNPDGRCNVIRLYNEAGNRRIVSVAAGGEHTLALLSDGTVLAVGSNKFGQCDVGSWKNIVAIYAGTEHSVGLCADGTVVATGSNEFGQCNVGRWSEIERLTAGNYFTVGIKADGTLVAEGRNNWGQIEITDLKNAVDVKGGTVHTVVVLADGSIIRRGYYEVSRNELIACEGYILR